MEIEKHINAVHDDNLKNLLKNIGYFDKVKKGDIKCKFCRDVITLENISAIFPESGSIKLICDKPVCIQELKTYIQENGIKQ
jgi:hypothetical protein